MHMTVRRRIHSVTDLPRSAKRMIAVLLDFAICLVSVWLAYYLRLGELTLISGNQWLSVVAACLAPMIFWVFGLYRAVFRFVGFEALMNLARACFIYGFIYATVFALLGVERVPRTVGLIQPVLLFLLVGFSRVFVRTLLGGMGRQSSASRVLIYGAGSSGRHLSTALVGSEDMDLVGFIDDDPTLLGARIKERRIYSFGEIGDVITRDGVTDVLLAMPSASRSRRREIVEALRPYSITVRTVPGLMDLASGKVQVNALRPIDIEDLLGRDIAAPDPILFSKSILGKVVLVTGAGGSIGGELCRQILAASPSVLLLFDISEFGLYSINEELREIGSETTRIVPLIGSVRDATRLTAIMRAWCPNIVFHAAAYKHVPLVEHNPVEGVFNNVMGTRIAAEAAIAVGVSDFVLISTDKAVRPTNVMGASKRMAELALQALAATGPKTKLSMVRFGNVLGSSGSVVPLFRRQIASGGPITVTHADVTRYFMTIPEAAQLVIQAAAMATGGEVFVLDMGEPVRIGELARKMVELSGLVVRDADAPDGDIEIREIGLRPGEKLYEELLIGDRPLPTAHPLIVKAMENHIPLAEFDELFDQLVDTMSTGHPSLYYEAIARLVPEFRPNSGMVDWLHLKQCDDEIAADPAPQNRNEVPD